MSRRLNAERNDGGFIVVSPSNAKYCSILLPWFEGRKFHRPVNEIADETNMKALVAAAQNRLFILHHLAVEHRAGDPKKLREAENVEHD